jgi:hypothetical protein
MGERGGRDDKNRKLDEGQTTKSHGCHTEGIGLFSFI